MLSAQDSARLESLARAVRSSENGNGVQLQFLLVPSLDGESIEDFSIRVAEAWKIGTKGKDNGLLFVVARDEHRTRIEVGGGLEGGLTDLQAGRILRDVVQPAFRAGQFGEGLYAGATHALALLGALPEGLAIDRAPPPGTRSLPRGGGLIGLLLFLVIFSVLSALLRPRRSGFFGRGGFYGGGFGGGGGGGGGWSGGGGGFSGGGASGGW